MLRKASVVCVVVAMLAVMLAGSAFAESNIKKLEIKNSTTVKNALILAGRDAKIGSVELHNVKADSVKIKNDTSVKNALVLAGRDAKIGSIELRNVTSDSIKIKNTTSVKNALVLAGRDAYIGNIMVD